MNSNAFARRAAFVARSLFAAALLLIAGDADLIARQNENAFRFQRFLSLKGGQRFRIIARNGYAAGAAIGEGRVLKLGARVLELDFQIETVASGRIRGELRLAHLGRRDPYKERIRLSFKGEGPDGPEYLIETVLADSFLIRNGVLSLHFADRKRFFQLSRDSRGRNSFITHWGASRLEALP